MKLLSAPPPVRFAVSVFVCLLAGIVGSFFTAPAIPTWYETLAKPPFNPPNWLFAPVWTALYVLMGVAAYLAWRLGLDRPRVRAALGLFLVQLILNVAWSAFFFGLNSPLAGLVTIAVLWVAVLATTLAFLRLSKLGGILLVPYLLWVSFAAILNLSIWYLNR